MKKLITLLLAMLLSFTCIATMTACDEKEETLYVYTEAGFPPYEYMQDGKLVGAVTHVFINDPTRGFGIKIETITQHPSTLSTSSLYLHACLKTRRYQTYGPSNSA